MAKVKPIVFEKKASIRCMICLDEEVSSWISESIKLTISKGEPRPSAEFVHGVLKENYPDRCPRSVTSTKSHLRNHESSWNSWGSSNEDS